jgi:hypothetical protein
LRGKFRIGAVIGAAAIACLSLAACDNSGSTTGTATGDQLSQQQQQADTTQLEYAVPLPSFGFSELRFELVQIEAVQALGINSTSYGFEPGIQHPAWTCPSIGLPVPATDQLSNPDQAQWNSGSGGNNAWAVAGVAVGQEDPNGVFQGDTTGTYSLCVTPTGHQYLQYNEGYTDATTAPSHWDAASGQIVLTGTPVLPKCVIQLVRNKRSEVCTKP